MPKIDVSQNKLGFTLIEINLAIISAVILILIISSVFVISQNAYNRSDSLSEISQNGRVILDRLSRELRQTNDIVTTLPETTADPDSLPAEIMFQDGHDTDIITYIRYYQINSDLYRQTLAYYFDEDPNNYVYHNAVGPLGEAPNLLILEDRLIGEYVYDVEFWGNSLVQINLYLLKNDYVLTLNTAIYGRNL